MKYIAIVGALSHMNNMLLGNITKMSKEDIYNSNIPVFWENINANNQNSMFHLESYL